MKNITFFFLEFDQQIKVYYFYWVLCNQNSNSVLEIGKVENFIEYLVGINYKLVEMCLTTLNDLTLGKILYHLYP